MILKTNGYLRKWLLTFLLIAAFIPASGLAGHCGNCGNVLANDLNDDGCELCRNNLTPPRGPRGPLLDSLFSRFRANNLGGAFYQGDSPPRREPLEIGRCIESLLTKYPHLLKAANELKESLGLAHSPIILPPEVIPPQVHLRNGQRVTLRVFDAQTMRAGNPQIGCHRPLPKFLIVIEDSAYPAAVYPLPARVVDQLLRSWGEMLALDHAQAPVGASGTNRRRSCDFTHNDQTTSAAPASSGHRSPHEEVTDEEDEEDGEVTDGKLARLAAAIMDET